MSRRPSSINSYAESGGFESAPSGGTDSGSSRDDDDDDDRRNDSRASRRVGGTGGRDDDDDDDRRDRGGSDDFRRDQQASRRVGGSGDPTESDTRTETFRADTEASRRVGGSGDPTDEPEPDTVDVGGAADSGQGPRVGISDQSPFVDVAAAAELDAQTQTDVGVGDIEIDGNTARLTRGAAVNEALSRQRDSRQGNASTDERFGDLDFSFGRGDPEVDEV